MVYSFAGLAGGVVAGLILGWLGSNLPAQTRIGMAILVSLAGVAVGLFSLLRGGMPLQCNRETPRAWVDTTPTRWAIQNGLVLGIGATSRLGFWLWYAVPLAALLFGSPWFGALIFGLFGGVRTTAVWLFLLPLPGVPNEADRALIAIQNYARMNVLASTSLIAVSIAVAVITF